MPTATGSPESDLTSVRPTHPWDARSACQRFPKMIDATNALIAYQTNPHLDQRERGIEAAKMMLKTPRGEATPTQSLVRLSFCVNIERQATDEPQGRELRKIADKTLGSNDACSASPVCMDSPTQKWTKWAPASSPFRTEATPQRNKQQTSLPSIGGNTDNNSKGSSSLSQQPFRLANAPKHKPKSTGRFARHGRQCRRRSTRRCHESDPCVEAERSRKVACRSSRSSNCATSKEAGLHQDSNGPSVGSTFQSATANLIAIDSTFDRFSEGRFHESGTTHGGYVDFDQGPTVVLEGRPISPSSRPRYALRHSAYNKSFRRALPPRLCAAILIKGVHAPWQPTRGYAANCFASTRRESPARTFNYFRDNNATSKRPPSARSAGRRKRLGMHRQGDADRHGDDLPTTLGPPPPKIPFSEQRR